MASARIRPRTLAIGFGVYFLVMAVIAWYAGITLAYHYSVDITRWTFTVYLLVGAVLLVGLGLGAAWTVRSLDAKIEALSGAASSDDEVIEEVAVEEDAGDEVPPPLEDTAAPSGDHVDRDIDELLVSLQEMEHEAETVEEPEPEEPPRTARAPRAAAARAGRSREDTRRADRLVKKRGRVVSYFAGPTLAAIGAIGISAAMLPGSDAFLQSYFQLNTALLLGLGYSFVGIAAYVGASFLLLVRAS